MPSFSRATAEMRCSLAACAISMSDGMSTPGASGGKPDCPRPAPAPALTEIKLLDEQYGDVGDVHHLGGGRSDQRLSELAVAARTDADEVAALFLGVLHQALGHRPDQHVMLVAHPGRIELAARGGEFLLAFF